MLSQVLGLILGNLGFFLAILAAIFSVVQCMINKKLDRFEIVYRWFACLPLGMTAIYAFILHAFFPDFTAAAIGWHNSPFQFEVAMANLGFGVIAILSIYGSYGFRLATVIGNACWLWGDAIGHSRQLIVHHYFSASHAGSWFYMDMLLPVVLLACIFKLYSSQKGR